MNNEHPLKTLNTNIDLAQTIQSTLRKNPDCRIKVVLPNGIIIEKDHLKKIQEYTRLNPALENINFSIMTHIDSKQGILLIKIIPHPNSA